MCDAGWWFGAYRRMSGAGRGKCVEGVLRMSYRQRETMMSGRKERKAEDCADELREEIKVDDALMKEAA